MGSSESESSLGIKVYESDEDKKKKMAKKRKKIEKKVEKADIEEQGEAYMKSNKKMEEFARKAGD